LPWRSGMLVTQMYRQYKQEILLGYNDFQQKMVVDDQHGYAKGYFDNYRNQIIFATEGSLEYMLGNKQITTGTDELTGYVYDVVLNDTYQIGIEILDVKRADLGSDKFFGARTRIIDLNTQESVTITGFPAKCILDTNKYVYCDNYDDDDNDFLDIIDVEMMEHTRLDTNDKNLTFFYQIGNEMFVQSREQKKTFKIDGSKLIEESNSLLKEYPVLDGGIGYKMIKDIAPINSTEHWYVNPLKRFDKPYAAEIFKFFPNKVDRVLIDFGRKDIIQIVDVANYGDEHVAILYQTQLVHDDPIYDYIAVYDMRGQLVELRDVSDLTGVGKRGRVIALDYVQ